MNRYQYKNLDSEFKFVATRSSGPGGQNVNKVNTKVELRFNVGESTVLSEEEKFVLMEKLKTRINQEGELILVSQSERSQLKNKEKVIERFYQIIEKALTPVKPRIKTKPTFSSRLKRLEKKKIQSVKKVNRRTPED